MFRFLFRSLIASRSQARSQARRPQPRLEAMEDRITPSPLAPPADGNLNAVADAGNASVARQEDQGHLNSISANHPNPAVPDKPSDNGDSTTACKDLLFQRLHGGGSSVPTAADKDSLFQELQDNGYLVWVAGKPDATPQTSDSPDVFMAFGDYLHAIEMEMTENAKIDR